jgi:hypothetical protein
VHTPIAAAKLFSQQSSLCERGHGGRNYDSRRMNEFSLTHDGSNVTQDKLAIKARSIVFI